MNKKENNTAEASAELSTISYLPRKIKVQRVLDLSVAEKANPLFHPML